MVASHKLIQVLLSTMVIAVVTWIGERHRGVAGILATMPLTILVTLVIVFQNTDGDHVKVSEFLLASLGGIVGTICFLLAAWWAASRRYNLWLVILIGYGAWGAALIAGRAISRLLS